MKQYRNPEIDPFVCVYLLYDRDDAVYQWGKKYFFSINRAEQMGYPYWKKKERN